MGRKKGEGWWTHFAIHSPNVTSLARFRTFCSFAFNPITVPFPVLPSPALVLASPVPRSGCETSCTAILFSANMRMMSSCTPRRSAACSSVSGGRGVLSLSGSLGFVVGFEVGL